MANTASLKKTARVGLRSAPNPRPDLAGPSREEVVAVERLQWMPSRWSLVTTKSFNSLTAAFQRRAATRDGGSRVVQWLCGDDAGAKAIVAGLITDSGFVPVDLGGSADAAVMEALRRHGAVYGEEYRERDAGAVVAAVRAGRPLPPTPSYS
jgi:predicted dinucleotide-binding enzyme